MWNIRKTGETSKITVVNPISPSMEFFLACAQAKSILKASEGLRIQQAGLSKVIKKLELELGQKLFIRTIKGVELTQFGQALYSSLLETKQFWTRAYALQLESLKEPSGVLKIGCHSSVAADTFPSFLPALLANFPMVKVEVVFSTSHEVTRQVADLGLDFGIVVNPVKNAGLVIRKIESQSVFLWGKSSAEKTIFYNPEMLGVSKFIRKYSSRELIVIRDYEVLAQLAKQPGCLAILPGKIAIRHGLACQSPELSRVTLALIWNKEKFSNSKNKQVIDLVLKLLET